MYITRKGQYALFFMINLQIHAGETVPVKQAAKEYDLSEKYLEQVASKLRHAGLVKVIRGNRRESSSIHFSRRHVRREKYFARRECARMG